MHIFVEHSRLITRKEMQIMIEPMLSGGFHQVPVCDHAIMTGTAQIKDTGFRQRLHSVVYVYILSSFGLGMN